MFNIVVYHLAIVFHFYLYLRSYLQLRISKVDEVNPVFSPWYTAAPARVGRRHIRVLENRLDKAMIKYNEAMSPR